MLPFIEKKVLLKYSEAEQDVLKKQMLISFINNMPIISIENIMRINFDVTEGFEDGFPFTHYTISLKNDTK